MFCSNCGNKLDDGSKFCSGCGAKVGEIKVEKAGKTKTQANKIPVAAQTYFEQGKKYQEKGDNKNACSSYKAAIDIAPDFWEAHKKFAVCLKDIERAYKVINNVISKNPDDYEAYLIRGKLYHTAGNTEKALLDYEIVLKLKPDDLETYKGMILVYKTIEAWDNVIEIASKAIEIAPQEYSLYYSRGVAFFRKNLFDNAVSDYSKSLEIMPDSTQTLSDIAYAYLMIEDYDNALKYMNRFFEKIPDNVDCAFIRGKIYYYKGEFEKAIKDFDVVEKHYGEGTNPELYKLRAISRYKMGYYKTHKDKIREDYLKICQLVPYNELNFFKELIIERYKKAILKYKGYKKTYLIGEYSEDMWGRSRWEDYLIIRPAYDPYGIRNNNDGALVFLNYDLAKNYVKLVTNHVGFYVHNRNKEWRFKVEGNIKKGTPKYWFIIHAESGYLYYKNGAGKYKSTWGFFKDDPGYKYESLDSAFKDYERIINSENLCNGSIDNEGNCESEEFTWDDDKYTYSSNNFMDIFIVGLGGTEEFDENSAEAFADKGDSCQEEKDYEQAVVEYTAAIKIDPSFIRAYEGRGWAYCLLNDYDKAIADFTIAINRDPDEKSFYGTRGHIYQRKKEFDNALADLNKVIELDPENSEGYSALAHCYNEMGEEYLNNGDFKKAIENITTAANIYGSYTSCSTDDLLEKIQEIKDKME